MVSEEILKRYERDYLVVSREVVGDALQDLEHMQQEASAVALILAGYGGLDADGVSFLARARGLHPRAKRAVVLRWGDFERAPEVFAAVAAGTVDYYLIRPEHARDEEFHAAVTQALEEWALAQGEGFEAVRVIGERLAPRSHEYATSWPGTTFPSASTRPALRPESACSPSSASVRHDCRSSFCALRRSPRCSATLPTSRSSTLERRWQIKTWSVRVLRRSPVKRLALGAVALVVLLTGCEPLSATSRP